MDILTLSMAKKYTDDSILGVDGVLKGEKGEPGYTPVRGVDYWTEEDKANILSDIDCASPIICEKSGSVVAINDSSDGLLKGLTLYGKTTQDGTPTPENPVELVSAGASGAINTTVCGKNLLGDNRGLIERTKNGITYTPVFREDGLLDYILLNGTATANSDYYCTTEQGYKIKMPKGATVVLSGGTENARVCLQDSAYNTTFRQPPQWTGQLYTGKLKYDTYGCWISVASGVTVNNEKIRPMVELGSVATEYEPYKGHTATFSTPNGLPGIPLGATFSDVIKASDAHMAGVWWDEKTQQYYISNTKVCNRGVDTQIVEMATATGDENWYKVSDATGGIRVSSRNYFKNKLLVIDGKSYLLCSHFTAGAMRVPSVFQSGNTEPSFFVPYSTVDEWKAFLAQQYAAGTPVVTLGIVRTPIETPLSAEEMAQFSALRTNKPNTTVYNDAGAGIELIYNADTKTYIDNKFSELAAALINSQKE